jgi:GT2 family glycosyltransferase
VTVVDDSDNRRTEEAVSSYVILAASKGIRVQYIRNNKARGNTIAKNMCGRASKGDIVLFLDDDVTLDKDYIRELTLFYESHPDAIGVQGYWGDHAKWTIEKELVNLFNRAFRLSCHIRGKCLVYQSFEPVYPRFLAEPMKCEWLSGCNQSYRKFILDEFSFDEKLKRYSPGGEEVDFSYRIYRKFGAVLYITPRARLVHRNSTASRTPTRNLVYLRNIYIEYFFNKNMSQTLRNKTLFAWSKLGRLLTYLLFDLRFHRKENPILQSTRAYFDALGICWKHKGELQEGKLEFADAFLIY